MHSGDIFFLLYSFISLFLAFPLRRAVSGALWSSVVFFLVGKSAHKCSIGFDCCKRSIALLCTCLRNEWNFFDTHQDWLTSIGIESWVRVTALTALIKTKIMWRRNVANCTLKQRILYSVRVWRMWQKKSVIISVQPEVGSYLRKAPIHMSIYSAIVRLSRFNSRQCRHFCPPINRSILRLGAKWIQM